MSSNLGLGQFYKTNLLALKNETEKYHDNVKKFLAIQNSDDEIVIGFNSFMKEFCESFESMLVRIKALIDTTNNNYIDIKLPSGVRWNDFYNKYNNDYVDSLKTQNVENIIDETKQLSDLKNKSFQIEQTVLPELFEKMQELQKCQHERDELLNNLNASYNLLSQTRIKTSERITDNFQGGLVKVTVSQKKNTKALKDYLATYLSGKNIKNLQDQIDNICNYIQSGTEFVDDIRESEYKNLSAKYRITENTAITLLNVAKSVIETNQYHQVAVKSINPMLFELDKLGLEDEITFEALDKTKTPASYKDIKRFSPGQRCSFMLGLLISANKFPLIIDQPEDELDWNYIDELIVKLKSLKVHDGNGRQFIFATHNQNITVLGDSEGIIYLENTPTNPETGARGNINASGGLDRADVRDAVLSLEGGADAFEKRKKKYGLK